MNQKKLIAIGIVAFLVVGVWGFKLVAANIARGKVDAVIAKMLDFADVDYGGIDVDLLGLDTHVKDIRAYLVPSGESLYVQELIIHDFDDEEDGKEEGFPSFVDVEFRGLQMDLGELGNDARPLYELGYKDKVFLNGRLSYRYDKEKKMLDLTGVEMGVSDMGTLKAAVRLGNIDLSSRGVLALPLTYPYVTVWGGEITYTDDSLAGRVLRKFAIDQGKDVETARKEIIREINAQEHKAKDDFVRAGWKALAKFAASPKRLSIKIAPNRPVPIVRLFMVRDINQAMKLLNLGFSY